MAAYNLDGHPGANPNYREYGERGQFRAKRRLIIDGEPRDVFTVLDSSRWRPHQGKRKCARRRAALTKASGH